jgi:hypothetical protein
LPIPLAVQRLVELGIVAIENNEDVSEGSSMGFSISMMRRGATIFCNWLEWGTARESRRFRFFCECERLKFAARNAGSWRTHRLGMARVSGIVQFCSE